LGKPVAGLAEAFRPTYSTGFPNVYRKEQNAVIQEALGIAEK
jgi:hypothetical protein